MSNLGSQQINATFGYLLQIPGGLTSSLVTVQDGSGNNLPISISTTGATGTFTGGTINGMVIGGVNPQAGTFTTLGGTTITASTQFTGPGTGLTGTASSLSVGGSAGSVSGPVAATTLSASGVVSGVGFSNYLASPPAIGSGTANTGAFTTLSASSTVSGVGFSNYLASPPAIGGTAAAAGTFTTLNATSLGATTPGTGAFTTLNATSIGATTAGTGAFTTLSASSTVSGVGFSNYLASPPAIGGTAPSTGKFTTLTATADSSFTSTGALLISKGTTGQQPGTPVTGMIRYNTTSNQFEGYAGASPSWLPVGGSVISNDTSTATPLYPVFANATSGTATTVYTSNANYLYTPSTGELQAPEHIASNGIFVNASTVNANYTISATNNGGSFGPITVATGVTVTVSSGATWTVV